jgi:valyl-tRNA synthetase
MPAGPPDKPSLDGLEERWTARWEEGGIYRFDRTKPRSEVFSVDTPPPTVSGKLHIGNAFGYIQTDSLVRFRRMAGAEVYYPMGWDDNGLNTERRVENYYGVRCDPSLPFDPDFTPPEQPDPKNKVPCSRPNFVALCEQLTAEDEQVFETVWRRLGLSVDWSLTYATIDERSRRASQRAFLRDLARGDAYSADAPTLWDVTYQTAVAQAELEDREVPGHTHRYGFRRPGGEPVVIETTRPELLPACVALVYEPGDERYADLEGTTVTSPLFGVEVPVLAHPAAARDKGTGIAMVCTFGDTTDVVWWRELRLPMRNVLQRDGRLQPEAPEAVTSDAGRAAYAEVAGRTANGARTRMVELLRESGELIGDPQPLKHPVKFHENGDRPLEVVTSRQWYVRNGAFDPALRQVLLERGRQLSWHPPSMHQRYESWVEGLNTDWLTSRQRYFGVPFPVWYPVRDDGTVDRDAPILADEDALPVDPSSDVPPGHRAEQRDRPGGFTGDPDVMDTWLTSSLTPLIVCGWEDDPDLFGRTFPMDLRPQGKEIIRTWLFSSVLRAQQHFGRLPWSDASINGWVLDPDRKKMSKTKGEVVTPLGLVDQHGADAIRYWAVAARPGTDTALDTNQFRVGRRLAIKVLNVTRFVLGLAATAEGAPATEPVDRAQLAALAAVVEEATTAFEGYDYARALERTEAAFWRFCDDYVELVKGRAYDDAGRPESSASAVGTLRRSLDVLLRLLAPFLPFATEEAWSWWHDGPIHRQSWPQVAADGADPLPLEVATDVLSSVRRAKTQAQRSLRAPVERVVVVDAPPRLDALGLARADVVAAGHITELELVPGEAPAVEVSLAEGSSPPA